MKHLENLETRIKDDSWNLDTANHISEKDLEEESGNRPVISNSALVINALQGLPTILDISAMALFPGTGRY